VQVGAGPAQALGKRISHTSKADPAKRVIPKVRRHVLRSFSIFENKFYNSKV
jgi:hypothetical protein